MDFIASMNFTIIECCIMQGDKTNAFYSPEDVIAIAKEVCKARFLGNWKLKIVDYSGKDLDSEILISEL